MRLTGFIFFIAAYGSFVRGFLDPKYASSISKGPSVPVDISSLFNSRAFASKPGDADMDGAGSGYPAEYLPSHYFTYAGINYHFPGYQASGNDNVRVSGETVEVSTSKYFSVHTLSAAESGASAEGTITATYKDGTTVSSSILVPVWWYDYLYGGDITFPYYYTDTDVDYNKSMIYQNTIKLDPTKELVSLQLPNVTEGLHLFSLSLLPVTKRASLEVEYARSTQKWLPDTDKVQIIEVIINNVGNEWITRKSPVEVSIVSPGLKTVTPAFIKRLRPGDQAKVVVGVVNTPEAPVGSRGEATVVLAGKDIHVKYPFEATYGIAKYEATYESIYTHESPSWFDSAKYGILIHWGLFSVPGWGNTGSRENYAEWYWWQMNAGPDTADQTYQYNLATYGPNHTYDEFMKGFTASAWDPKEWVDLFADAGANYFVLVTKHHDGYALFNVSSEVTLRTSVAQLPHRNFVQELFDAAKEYQPSLHRATYFSLPEWFNPAYTPYGQGRWPGGNATNPYTNVTLPYTGYVDVDDFLQDIMLPQMNTLADMGTEIIWCDVGGANVSVEFAANWFNTASERNAQVAMNNRCGIPGDFDTPEYATLNTVQARKWESNLGMDPYSYGYNRATPVSSYMNASTIITSLIDIISKNGNLLLDVGPQANGSILQVEQDHLRTAGAWIEAHGEAIFNTTYWFFTPEEGDALRFTQTLDAFYIHCLERPNSTLVVASPVPYLPGDQVVAVGGKRAGSVVPSRLLPTGSLELSLSMDLIAADDVAWVFKIPY